MSYLTEEAICEIQNSVSWKSINEIDDISQYSFESGIEEYNDFLKVSQLFWDLNVSKTYFLIHKKENVLLAYMTLSADSVKLKPEERMQSNLKKVPYASLPALKVGKLAVNKAIPDQIKRKGYGSFMIGMAIAYVNDMNDMGVACRLITVDADVEYDEKTVEFYKKNGFVENKANKSRNSRKIISMRLDCYEYETTVTE